MGCIGVMGAGVGRASERDWIGVRVGRASVLSNSAQGGGGRAGDRRPGAAELQQVRDQLRAAEPAVQLQTQAKDWAKDAVAALL